MYIYTYIKSYTITHYNMYVLARKLLKYNAYYIEKNTQHNAICYYSILLITHYLLNVSNTQTL